MSQQWMNWEHLGELAEAGWTIGAHTASHMHLAQLFLGAIGLNGPQRVAEELLNYNRSIEKELGFKPAHFAYPSADWSEEVEAFVVRYYRTARLGFGDDHVRLNTLLTHPYRLNCVLVSMNMSDAMLLRLLDARNS